jgi:hypothetical protein
LCQALIIVCKKNASPALECSQPWNCTKIALTWSLFPFSTISELTVVERILKPSGKFIFFEQGSHLSLPSSAGKGRPAAVPPAKNEHCGGLITLWESGSPAIAPVRDRRCSFS